MYGCARDDHSAPALAAEFAHARPRPLHHVMSALSQSIRMQANAALDAKTTATPHAEAGPDVPRLIKAAFDALQLIVIDSGSAGDVVAISLSGTLTSVRPAWLNGMQGGEWGVLISVETSVTLDHLLKPGVVTILQAAGALLADSATAIGGDAHGRILLLRAVAVARLTAESLAAMIASMQHLQQLLDVSPERSALPT